MKIVLTHGYFIHEDIKEQSIMRPYPPLGILYVSAYLKQNGHDVTIIDSTFKSQESWKTEVEEVQPDIVFFYTNLMTKVNIIKLNSWLKANTGVKFTGVGGPDVTYNIENYLKHGFDVAIIGEGEQSAEELVSAIQNNSDWNAVSGIAFQQNGQITQTPARIKMKDLSDLPLPDRESIDLQLYLSIWKKYHGKATVNISSQRGCPYSCKWCSTAVYGRSYRRRPAHQVADEIEYLQKEYGVEALWFVDDVFTVKFKWVRELYEEFQKRNLEIDFEIISRAERLNDEILGMLKEMGCFRIWIGAESGSQDVINAMRRSVSVDEVREKIKLTQSYGIEAGTFIMVGYPGEMHRDIKETANHLKVAPPDEFTITKAYPIKGTELYQEVEDKITSNNEWATTTDRDTVFEMPYSDAYYQNAIRYIANTWKSSLAFRKKQYSKHLLHKAKAHAAYTLMRIQS